MLKIWEKHPRRFGIIAGLFALPLGWWLQELVLALVVGRPLPSGEKFFAYCFWGALPGAILGEGISAALLFCQQNDLRKAKRRLISCSCAVLSFIFLFVNLFIPWGRSLNRPLLIGTTQLPAEFRYFINPLFYQNFAVYCALLMLFIGLLMRARR